jgi:DNA-binding LacI/PurR family transcriptional regulator
MKRCRMKVKIKDIAQALGVSSATVSLVLNGKPGVSDARREEVLAQVRQMGGESLIKSTEIDKGNINFVIMKTHGKIIDEFPFFSYLQENMNKIIMAHGYRMNIIYIQADADTDEINKALNDPKCKGYIIYAVEMFAEDLKAFQNISVPIVFLDNSFPGVKVDTVSIDNQEGVYQALDYLIRKNHKTIGYIKSKVKIQSFDERFDAFNRKLKSEGLTLQKRHIMHVGYSESQTMNDVADYLNSESDWPTAFFADNDLLACRVVQALKLRGIAVPEKISIIGFDNRPICEFTEPAVSTIAIPRDDMGKVAIEMLLSKLKNTLSASCKVLIGTTLIERNSVAKIK